MIAWNFIGMFFILAAQTAPEVSCAELQLPAGDLISGPVGAKAHDFMQSMAGDGYSGAVLISRRGQVLLKKGYGYADRDNEVANTSETLFNVASVSKTFTAAAIMRLEEQGKVAVEERLSEYLGPFPQAKSAATVHQLLTHTAGLVVRGVDLDYDNRPAFVESVKQAPIESRPGEEYRYTNAGYTMLAAVIEEVTGERIDDYLDRYIFGPACMTKTAYVWDSRIDGEPIAVGYSGGSVDELSPVPRRQDIWGDRGPGSIATTVGDLLLWVRAIRDARVMSRESIDKIFTAYVGDEGYGWHVIDSDNGRLVRRGGGLPEFESSLRWYIDEDIVIIVTINNHIGFRLAVVNGLEEIIFAAN